MTDQDASSFPEDMRHLLVSWLSGWTEHDCGLMVALLEGGRTDGELARLRRERLSRPVRQVAESVLDAAVAEHPETGTPPR